MRNNLALLFGLLLILPLTAANGLQVFPSSIEVNKTAGQTVVFNLTIQNQEPQTFYNITFEDNSFISIPRIPSLASGHSINVTATLNSDTPSNSSIRLRGFYPANVGQQQKTVHVNITSFRSTPCSFTITKGDRVVWKSYLLNPVQMISAGNNLPVDGANIPGNGTYEKTFSAPETFQHYFSMSGFSFPETCTITVLDDTGFVNDPQLNGLLNLNLRVAFEPTNISLALPVSSYIMDFFENAEGVLTIQNTGNKPAKHVTLTADWIQFSRNNFDIAPGETRAVTFTIIPIVSSTEDTNKSYTKQVSVTGNFDTAILPLHVFIKHQVISNNGSGSGSLPGLIDEICRLRPDLCRNSSQVIYSTAHNGSQRTFNITLTEEQLRIKDLAALEENERRQAEFNFWKEEISSQQSYRNLTDEKLARLYDEFLQMKQDQQNSANTVQTTLTVGGLVFLAGLLGVAIYIQRAKNEAGRLKRW